MKEFFKGKFITILVVSATVILAGVATFTAVRLYQLRSQSVSPVTPERPSASTTTPPPACRTLTFNLTLPSTTPVATPTLGPSITATLAPTQPPSGPPGAPVCTATKPAATTVTSVTRSGTKATVTWTKVTPTTHYTISYGLQSGTYEFGVPNTGNVTSYTIGSLDPAKKYYFVVYAVNDCMPSDVSAVATSVASAGSENLPVAGIAFPTIAGLGIGILVIALALVLAL